MAKHKASKNTQVKAKKNSGRNRRRFNLGDIIVMIPFAIPVVLYTVSMGFIVAIDKVHSAFRGR